MEYRNVTTPQELLEFMDIIEYGYSVNGKKYGYFNEEEFELHINEWKLSSPENLLQTKIGHCYDQVELERDWFKKHGYKFHTYFTIFLYSDKYTSHTFLIYEDNDKYYYFEHSWGIMKGIYEFNSLSEAYCFVIKKHLESNNPDLEDIDNLILREYKDIKYNIGFEKFINDIIDLGVVVDIDDVLTEYKMEIVNE